MRAMFDRDGVSFDIEFDNREPEGRELVLDLVEELRVGSIASLVIIP